MGTPSISTGIKYSGCIITRLEGRGHQDSLFGRRTQNSGSSPHTHTHTHSGVSHSCGWQLTGVIRSCLCMSLSLRSLSLLLRPTGLFCLFVSKSPISLFCLDDIPYYKPFDALWAMHGRWPYTLSSEFCHEFQSLVLNLGIMGQCEFGTDQGNTRVWMNQITPPPQKKKKKKKKKIKK